MLGGFLFGAGEIRVISGRENPAGAPKGHKPYPTIHTLQTLPYNSYPTNPTIPTLQTLPYNSYPTNPTIQTSPHNSARTNQPAFHILSYSFIFFHIWGSPPPPRIRLHSNCNPNILSYSFIFFHILSYSSIRLQSDCNAWQSQWIALQSIAIAMDCNGIAIESDSSPGGVRILFV